MWLLNTETIRLRHFQDHDAPEYAILSHRWEDQEISFANMRDCQMIDDNLSEMLRNEERMFPAVAKLRRYRIGQLKSMNGWKKIEKFCLVSRGLMLGWAWVDTVCIDKSSSAELQEAINAMFKWYQGAEKCVVYMNDVKHSPLESPIACGHEFRQSAWFRRGWTLQELLAPSFGTILFYNRDWTLIGSDKRLIGKLVSITNIPKQILEEEHPKLRFHRICYDHSVAQRLSWAADRQVTRPEDAAYSLLGLFDINMPMLYGEGKFKAFERLQLEILKQSEDETILAWNIPDAYDSFCLLAPSPERFSGLGMLRRDFDTWAYFGRGGMLQMTAKGLLMDAILIDRRSKDLPTPPRLYNAKAWKSRFASPLPVSKSDRGRKEIVILQLEHYGRNEYFQCRPNFLLDLGPGELDGSHKTEQFTIRSSRRTFPL